SKNVESEDSDVDDVLSKLQKILKKKKNGSRRIQKKEKKEKEPVCYEYGKPGHLRPDCPKLKKTGQPEKSKKQHKKFKRKAMTATWDNEEATTSESSNSDSEKEQESLARMDSLGASGTKDAQGTGTGTFRALLPGPDQAPLRWHWSFLYLRQSQEWPIEYQEEIREY
ncbi:hypothetical protein Taro_031300, partial [Colocasia esculenta]|nr:hypothetical protein [Colocasia esculenta]